MAIDHASDPLPCGRLRADVWDDAEAGRLDDHERTCPYCREAVAAHEPLRRATTELATRPIHPPVGLVGDVMRTIRGGLLPGSAINLPAPTGSELTVSETAATALLAAAADTADGVLVHDCRFTDPEAPISVDVTGVLRPGHTVPAAAAEVRALITEAAHAMLGLTLERVNVTITDIQSA